MRITITIDDAIFRAIKIRAFEADKTVSEFIENAIKCQLLEDLKDIKDAKSRELETEYSFDSLVSRLKSEGLL